jgi:cytoskeletal protein CcmA (bactofilin family)
MFTKKPERETAGEPSRPLGASEPSRPFGDRAATASRPAAPAASAPAGMSTARKGVPSIIGEDLTIIGNITSKGEIQVDGEIQGDVRCVSLLLGDKSKIVGEVIADDIVVRGMVNGSIRGLRVTLQAQSRVEGDIHHQSLAIEQGAYFEGKSRRSDDPLNDGQIGDTKPAETKMAAKAPEPAKPFGFDKPAETPASTDADSKANAAE